MLPLPLPLFLVARVLVCACTVGLVAPAWAQTIDFTFTGNADTGTVSGTLTLEYTGGGSKNVPELRATSISAIRVNTVDYLDAVEDFRPPPEGANDFSWDIRGGKATRVEGMALGFDTGINQVILGFAGVASRFRGSLGDTTFDILGQSTVFSNFQPGESPPSLGLELSLDGSIEQRLFEGTGFSFTVAREESDEESVSVPLVFRETRAGDSSTMEICEPEDLASPITTASVEIPANMTERETTFAVCQDDDAERRESAWVRIGDLSSLDGYVNAVEDALEIRMERSDVPVWVRTVVDANETIDEPASHAAAAARIFPVFEIGLALEENIDLRPAVLDDVAKAGDCESAPADGSADYQLHDSRRIRIRKEQTASSGDVASVFQGDARLGDYILRLCGDDALEVHETFGVGIEETQLADLGLVLRPASRGGSARGVTIRDTDTAAVSLEASRPGSQGFAEGEDATFEVKLTRAAGADVVLGWSVEFLMNRGQSGDDFVGPFTGRITIPAGTEADVPVVFAIGIVDDTTNEGLGRLTATIADFTNSQTRPAFLHDDFFEPTVRLGFLNDRNTAEAHIRRSDPLSVSLTGPATANEGTVATYTLAVTGGLSISQIGVPFSTGGTSMAGTDYGPITSSPILIAPGENTATFTVSFLDDGTTDAGETLELELGMPSSEGGGVDGDVVLDASASSVTTTIREAGTAGVTVSKTRVSVAENEGATTYEMALNTQPAQSVTVTVTSGDPTVATVAPSSLIFDASNWSTSKEVTVTGANDSIVNASARTATIGHSVSSADANYDSIATASVTAIALDDDVRGVTITETEVTIDEDGGTATYTVVLDTQPTGSVTVTVTVPSSDRTVAMVEPSSLDFDADNWDTPQQVTVTGIDDSVANVPARTATIAHDVSGADYDSLGAASVKVTATDDDNTQPVIAPVSDLTIPLGLTVPVGLAVADPDVGQTISWTASSDDPDVVTVTPTSGSGRTATLTLKSGSNLDDTTITLTATDSSGMSNARAEVSFMATVSAPSMLTLTPSRPRVGEGETLSVTARLDLQAGQAVTVTLERRGSAAPHNDYSIGSITLTFNVGDQSKETTIAIVDDDIVENDETIVLDASVSSRPPITVVGTDQERTVTIVDTDEATVSVADESGTEGDRLRFFARLSARVSSDVTVALATQDGTAMAGADYAAAGAEQTINSGLLIGFPPLIVGTNDDPDEEDTETFVVKATLRSPPARVTLLDGTATGVIVDNDRTDTTVPTLQTATVDGAKLVLAYNEQLDTMSTPAVGAYVMRVAGIRQTISEVAVIGRTVRLTLAQAPGQGRITINYEVPNANPVQDAAGNDAEALTRQTVTILTGDTTAPALQMATVNVTNLVLTYDETLDTTSTPTVGAYAVTVAGTPVTVSGVVVSERTVTLALNPAVAQDRTVTVTYTVPTGMGAEPVRTWRATTRRPWPTSRCGMTRGTRRPRRYGLR